MGDRSELEALALRALGEAYKHVGHKAPFPLIDCAKLIARRLQPARVPEGWQLVPREATMQMRSGRGVDHVTAANIWTGMLAAAPAAEGGMADAAEAAYLESLADDPALDGWAPEPARRLATPAPESREAREICGKETGTTCANPNCYACTQYDAERSRNAGVQRWTLDEAPQPAKPEAGQREGVDWRYASNSAIEYIDAGDTEQARSMLKSALSLASAQQAGMSDHCRVNGCVHQAHGCPTWKAGENPFDTKRTGSRGEGE